MIKILKIACFIAVIACISAIIFAGIGFYRGNDGARLRQEFLDSPTIIDKFKELTNVPQAKQDKESPLVVQARALGLRLDPPPPPKSITQAQSTGKRSAQTINKTITPPPPPRNATFKLVATCKYDNYPEKSLALIDITSEGSRWVRQGDLVGQHTIHQINDGNIVVYQNGELSGEFFMPPDNSIKSLLSDSSTPADTVDIPAAPALKAKGGSRSQPNQQTGNRVPAAENIRSTRPVRKLPVPLTPQQHKQSQEESISAIKKIINETSSSDSTDDKSKKNDIEIWNQLLKMLEEDKTQNELNKKSQDAEKTKK